MGRPKYLPLVFSLLLANLTAAAGNPNPPTIFLNPMIVTGGLKSIAIVTLPSPAPAEGVIVRLTASNVGSPYVSDPTMRPVASVPTQVMIPAGANATSFAIDTRPVASKTSVSISASVGDTSAVVELSVVPPSLARTRLRSGFVHGGKSITGEVILTGPAPEGGFTVSLKSYNEPIATTPAAVTVPAGQSTATYTVQTKQVSTPTSVTIGASSPMMTSTAPLRVMP